MAFLKSPFTATRVQVATYLLCVALFSISFLVFLNASVSFVITDLIGQQERVGDAVGTLGFADEVVALFACPLWGLLSDKIGVRFVCVLGYAILGVSLFVFVQARNVFPQLLLARIFFSVGGAATATMVTAVLPAMTFANDKEFTRGDRRKAHTPSLSTASEVTITPENFASGSLGSDPPPVRPSKSGTSQVAGFVGIFTGCGALLALGIFLPLPARLSNAGQSRQQAVISSFYIVGAIALVVGGLCFFGLRNLETEKGKSFIGLFRSSQSEAGIDLSSQRVPSVLARFQDALILGFTDSSIGLGYLGGFVARASSVGISLFIPLYVNEYFIRTGLCTSQPSHGPTDPSDVKAHCQRAYILAASLSGASQAVALVCAPIFGWADGRFHRYLNAPLLFAAVVGVIGYVVLANTESPEGNAGIWVCMVFLGISQIGAIVCSLSSLSRGIGEEGYEQPSATGEQIQNEEEDSDRVDEDEQEDGRESAPLISSQAQAHDDETSQILTRNDLKGTIAGLYSLAGGAGILLLTKLGGYLFDKTSPGAPFYMLAIFNAILLIVTLVCSLASSLQMRRLRTEA